MTRRSYPALDAAAEWFGDRWSPADAEEAEDLTPPMRSALLRALDRGGALDANHAVETALRARRLVWPHTPHLTEHGERVADELRRRAAAH